MGNKCSICGCNPGPFFVWSSTRNFPREKLMSDVKDKHQVKMILEGVPVCYACYDKLSNDE